MPVVLNKKICDNASACGAPEVCPVGAFVYNKKKKRLEIDNSKCTSCGLCEPTCPIGAIGVAYSESDYNALLQDVENDPRTEKDLFVDRYGADLVDEAISVDASNLDVLITKNKNGLVELYDPNTANCLIKSIPAKVLLQETKLPVFNKCIANEAIIIKYNVTELPALLAYKNGKITSVTCGYFEEKDLQKLVSQIK